MLNPVLSPDTQAILLLCSSFGEDRLSEPQPLTLSEYNILAGWLLENKFRPGDLLTETVKNKLQNIEFKKVDYQRLNALLERGFLLSLAVEKWTSQGLWILGRGDHQYPKCLKHKLKQKAPALLYGIGNLELLSAGGLAIVGSRDISEAEIEYTQTVAKLCAEQGIQVISGGARGVDQVSMLGVLEASGTAVGVLADSLTKTSVNGKYRYAIAEGRLTLISPYDPSAGFNTGNAMGRNKDIYGLADYALVVSASYQKGGTWAGAKEALEKIQDVPVFVRIQNTVPEGNQHLIQLGAKPFPNIPTSSLKEQLRTLLDPTITESDTKKRGSSLPFEGESSETFPNVRVQDAEQQRFNPKPLFDPKSQIPNPKSNDIPEISTTPTHSKPLEIVEPYSEVTGVKSPNIYEVVLPLILEQLKQPLDAKTLAERLEVRLVQIQDWLNKAVAEGKVIKTNKPVAYVVNLVES